MPPSQLNEAKAAPVRKRTGRTHERIHSDIYAAIIHHQLRPATPLHEDALAGAFGVSRTIIRKVLLQLSHEKLVEIIPNKGAIVARPSIEEARQIFEARRMVECLLVAELAPAITEEGLRRLSAVVGAEGQSEDRGDKQGRLQLSGDFHRELAALGGNAVMRDFVHELISRSSLIIALYELPGTVPCSCDEHRQIIDALIAHDPAAAAKRMADHLHHIEAQIDLSDIPAKIDFKTMFRRLA